MTKVKSNALWNELSPAQRETLAEWLFDERASYREAWQRAQTEFGFKGSVSSIRRFYERTAWERLMTGFNLSAKQVKEIQAAPVESVELREAGLKVVGRLFLQQVTEAPERMKEWTPLAKLLLRQEEQENRRAWKAEEIAIRRERLELARARLEASLRSKSKKEAAVEGEDDGSIAYATVDDYEHNRRVNAVSKKLFGKSAVLLPESPKKEAANPPGKDEGQAEA